ncbi:structural protein [Raoultella phage Ro1]|uniref:Structural protein n=1 Tax=Raoultella phage Ro1 TaxID=2053702 RepID=A0A2H4YGW0_9CAUD|nr:structural protein [Raoultella phage Ro1]AUE23409.1 structural protein [Raoultella phage Ro1]
MDTRILTPYAYDPQKARLYMMTQRVTGFAADTKIVVARNEDNIIPHMGLMVNCQQRCLVTNLVS